MTGKVFWDEATSSWVIRASSLGDCPRKLAEIACGREESHPTGVLRAFAAGNEHELIVKDRLRRAGITIFREQEELGLDFGSATVRGHWDGACTAQWDSPSIKSLFITEHAPLDTECCLEVKSMAESSYEKWLACGVTGATYRAQISAYSLASGLPIVYVCQCKSDLSLSARYYPGPFEEWNIAAMMERVELITDLISRLKSSDTLPPCTNSRDQQFDCSFHDLHHAPETKVLTIEDPGVHDAFRTYQYLGEQIKFLEEKRAQSREIIQSLFADGHNQVKCAGFSASYVSSRVVDYGAFFRSHPDLASVAEQYKSHSSFLRINAPRAKKFEGVDHAKSTVS